MKSHYEPLEQEKEELITKSEKHIHKERLCQAALVCLFAAITFAGAVAYTFWPGMAKLAAGGKQGAGLLFL